MAVEDIQEGNQRAREFGLERTAGSHSAVNLVLNLGDWSLGRVRATHQRLLTAGRSAWAYSTLGTVHTRTSDS